MEMLYEFGKLLGVFLGGFGLLWTYNYLRDRPRIGVQVEETEQAIFRTNMKLMADSLRRQINDLEKRHEEMGRDLKLQQAELMESTKREERCNGRVTALELQVKSLQVKSPA